MVTGDNGIAQKALDAKEKTSQATEEEEQQLSDAVDYIDSKVQGGTTSGSEGTTLSSQIDASNYGEYVNYEVDLGIATAGNALADSTVPTTDWRIFYDDGSNVYLIASDYLPASKFPSGVFGANNGSYNGYWSVSDSALTTSGTITTNTSFLFTKLSSVTTTNYNYQAVSTLLDSSKWSTFANSEYVDNVNTAVIGSPTVEMWMASWNEKYNDTLAFDANTTGYQVGLTEDSLSTYISSTDMQAKERWSNTLYYPHASSSSAWNSCYGYWLASPSANDTDGVMRVGYYGSVDGYYYGYSYYGVRPVVSLSSDVTATQDEDGVWQLN